MISKEKSRSVIIRKLFSRIHDSQKVYRSHYQTHVSQIRYFRWFGSHVIQKKWRNTMILKSSWSWNLWPRWKLTNCNIIIVLWFWNEIRWCFCTDYYRLHDGLYTRTFTMDWFTTKKILTLFPTGRSLSPSISSPLLRDRSFLRLGLLC